jgi:hypothetical protein
MNNQPATEIVDTSHTVLPLPLPYPAFAFGIDNAIACSRRPGSQELLVLWRVGGMGWNGTRFGRSLGRLTSPCCESQEHGV